MSYGLSSTGWLAKRADDVRRELQDEIVTRLDAAGLPSEIDFSRDTIAGILVDAFAVEIGRLWEAAGAVYDATDPANATGILLANIGQLRGVTRLPATFSRIDLTLSGTPGAVIPSGSLVEGGGDPEQPARWSITSTVTIGGGGTVAAEAVATVAGAITAGAADVSTIVTPIAGWASVVGSAPAVPGRDVESDAAYRARQRLAPLGRLSVGGIRLALLNVDGVQAAVVLENRTASDLTIGSKTLSPHSVLPVLLPAGLTTSQQQAVGRVLFDGTAGIKVGGASASDNEVTVEGDGFEPVTIGWDDAGTDSIPIVVTLALAGGFALGDVSDDVEAAVLGYVNALSVGETARLLAVQVAVAGVEGVVGATVTLDGVGADYVPDPFDVVRATTVTVTT